MYDEVEVDMLFMINQTLPRFSFEMLCFVAVYTLHELVISLFGWLPCHSAAMLLFALLVKSGWCLICTTAVPTWPCLENLCYMFNPCCCMLLCAVVCLVESCHLMLWMLAWKLHEPCCYHMVEISIDDCMMMMLIAMFVCVLMISFWSIMKLNDEALHP